MLVGNVYSHGGVDVVRWRVNKHKVYETSTLRGQLNSGVWRGELRCNSLSFQREFAGSAVLKLVIFNYSLEEFRPNIHKQNKAQMYTTGTGWCGMCGSETCDL